MSELTDRYVKFELSKLLIKDKTTKEEGKKILKELLNTKSKNYALLELGKLEVKENNFESARYIFEELLNSNSRIYALIELGKLELLEGNKGVASSYFSKVKHENCADKRWGLIEIKKVKEDLLEIENKKYVISDKPGYLKVN